MGLTRSQLCLKHKDAFKKTSFNMRERELSGIIDKVKQAILPVLQKENVELVDVEFEKKYGQDNLTVFIHKPGGIMLDDCERVHLAIDPVLDETDPTNGQPYVLNVSSPGLDRPFKTQRDFERNYGEDVEVKLFAPLKGEKIYEGTLVCREENTTTVNTALGGEIKIENNKISLVRPLIKI